MIFIIRFSQGEAGQVSGALFMMEFGQILPFSFTQPGFFFFFLLISSEICLDIELIFNLCYHIVVLKKKPGKVVKDCKYWASMGHTQNEAQFCFENNKWRS